MLLPIDSGQNMPAAMADHKASSTEELVKRRSGPCGCLGWFSAKITGSMENGFYRLLRSTGILVMIYEHCLCSGGERLYHVGHGAQ